MAASSSQGQMNWQTPGDLIIYSLEDLIESDFKRFKNKLSDFCYENKPPIPRGKLEHADCITTKDILIDTHGGEGALDVIIKVLTLIGLLGPANDLQIRRTKMAKLNTITNSNRLAECKKDYMNSMKEDFQRIKEYNSRRGETVSLQNTYIELQLIKGPQIMEEKMHEILNSGKGHLHNLKEKSGEDSPITIQTLFDPDKDGFIPKIVVLQGPAGIGKTMTSRKIMLDWASGNLYKDEFDFVFHLSCKELSTIIGPISLVGLLSRTCKLQLSSDDLVSILKDPDNHRKLLFILDGFDELSWTLEKKSEACRDIFEETHKDLLLQRLLRKQILKPSSLIITTRPLALEKLHSFVEESRDVEVMGFTEEDRKEYLLNFFKNEDDADKALSIIKDNAILYTMCAVPIVCWIVCTVLKPQIKQDLDLLQYNTATSIYLLYLKSLIKHHCRNQPTNACLKKLCALAKEGILNQKILFEMEDLNRHGLSLSEVESVFLNENLFHQDIDTQTFYSFIHLSVQEFLAALYYVLGDGSGNEDGTTGPREGTSIPEICKGNSLSAMCVKHPHLTLAVRFLFGLLNEKDVRKFSKDTGINISLPARREMEGWLMGEWLLTNLYTGNSLAPHYTEAISCLYETQDQDIIRKIFSSSPHLEVAGARKGGFWTGENCSKQLCYCLQTCESLQALSFTYLILDPKYLKMLSSLIHRCQQLSFQNVKLHSGDSPRKDKLFTFTQYDELPDKEEELFISSAEEVPANLSWLTYSQSNIRELKFNHCGLTASSCNDICSFMWENRLLTSLDLSDNRLRDPGLKILCEGLKNPACTLKVLRIWQCKLTPLCCDDLRSLLITNRSLTHLDLSTNTLMDSGIKILCDGLKDPGCTLQELKIEACSVTPLSCDDLRSVLIANRSLTKLDLSLNFLEDSGIKLICEGLKHPDCILQELRFDFCHTTLSCCDDLCSAISTNRNLRMLETRIKTEISESVLCFEDLRHLGCTVEKFGQQIDITYRRPRLQE
ncbi:NACHT, LRR and PYD domains-containing protein 3-like [Rana temporaria]|uniref:NACHT, LRR and PYD domains-containing protein 3-like n=1 Tax=Rana temporaria TaxID=8407 RepID=UPI001AACD26B|nr:NACHT, LRR and PYD domains-containing protein 3-like [Rana temporaria]XP_040177146.1 NACHT, LRR and PYD domains-containing protein 3-like [Rana temporaria]